MTQTRTEIFYRSNVIMLCLNFNYFTLDVYFLLLRDLCQEAKTEAKFLASVNQQTIPDQTIVSTTSQVNKDSSPVHYQTMV